jgi:hypothetical protein
MINPDLIKKFREKVNSDSYFTLYNYKNKQGRNHWNLICSCMDWIEVATDYLVHEKIQDKNSAEKLHGDNINTKCMLSFTYISAIDIVWESVKQLHRAIIDKNTIPFKNKKGIFNDYSICNNDNEYFDHIRAVFGAHSTNLNKEGKGKWFASWPTDHVYTEYDYAVNLYNADVEGDDMVFGFRFHELDEFLESRYGYLKVLIENLNEQYQQYKLEKMKHLIEKVEDEKKQLEILKEESLERLDNGYYTNIIEELQIIFKATCSQIGNKEIVDKYLNECRKIISEVMVHLQSMEFKELEFGWIVDSDHPNEIHYELSKIYECLRGKRNDFRYNYYIAKISKLLNIYVTITAEMDMDEVFLLIKVGLYSYWIKHDKRL